MSAVSRTDLAGFGFAPGHYLNRCIECPDERDHEQMRSRNQFTGAKGSYRCETHATAAKARHKDEMAHAAEVAREGLMISLSDGMRILAITPTDYGQGLRIETLTKGGDPVTFKAVRVRSDRESVQITPPPGSLIIRCMGGRKCDHRPGTCTATLDA